MMFIDIDASRGAARATHFPHLKEAGRSVLAACETRVMLRAQLRSPRDSQELDIENRMQIHSVRRDPKLPVFAIKEPHTGQSHLDGRNRSLDRERC